MDIVSALRTFQRVVETGSFSAAAHDLDVTQSQGLATGRGPRGPFQHPPPASHDERPVADGGGGAHAADGAPDSRSRGGAWRCRRIGWSHGFGKGEAERSRAARPLSQRTAGRSSCRPSETLCGTAPQGTKLRYDRGTPRRRSASGFRRRQQPRLFKRIGWTTAFLVASPAYLARKASPRTPKDIKDHECLCYSRAMMPVHGRSRTARKTYPSGSRRG